MPNPFPKFLPALPSLGALVLLGCFGSDVGDSPFTIHKGEVFERLQLEIEPDGTVLILAQAAMYMAHNDPQTDWDRRIQVQNYHSSIYRRTTGGWNATSFKNIQERPHAFPALLPAPDGIFQAFIWDGGQIKRMAHSDGSWNRIPGTEWPAWIEEGGTFGSQNWTRHPRIAVAGQNLLLTLHEHWDKGRWVSEGAGRKVHLDTGWFSSTAFHTAPRYRALLGTCANAYIDEKMGFTTDPCYNIWREGDIRADRILLGSVKGAMDGFFSPYRGGTAIFIPTQAGTFIFSLDGDGKVTGSDTVPTPKDEFILGPMIASDSAGCIHGLNYQPGTAAAWVTYIHWNSCDEKALDTLAVPNPEPGRQYHGAAVKLRLAPDGTPTAALIVQEVTPFPLDVVSSVPPSFLFLAELRGGKWILERVAERVSR